MKRIRAGEWISDDGWIRYLRVGRRKWVAKLVAGGQRIGAWPTLKEAAEYTSGDCYQAAFNALQGKIRYAKPDDSGHWLLCHGTVTGQGQVAGVRFGHAWIEYVDIDPDYGVSKAKKAYRAKFDKTVDNGLTFKIVVDRSQGRNLELPAALYYAIGHISDVHRYTYHEAVTMLADETIFGPWE